MHFSLLALLARVAVWIASSTSSTSTSSKGVTPKSKVIISPGGTKRPRGEVEVGTTPGDSVFEDDGVTPKAHAVVKDNSHLIAKAKAKKMKYVSRDFFGRKVSESDMKGKKRVRASAPTVVVEGEENAGKNATKKSKMHKTTGNKHVEEEDDEEDETMLSMTMFKFIPGFTNAVKRRVNMGEFL